MKHRFLAAFLILSAATASAEPEKVFNGTGLEGWKTEGAAYWTAADGVLKGESDDKKQNSVLWTEKSYKDFTMEFDFRFSGDVDSGVFLRGKDSDQIQIGTSRSLKRDMTCSPYIGGKGYPKEAQGVKELLKEGEWNHMKIVAKGNTYTIFLNGKQVNEYVSDTAKAEGPLGLQIHPNVKMKIEFKSVTVEGS